jgi:hypothetical protein
MPPHGAVVQGFFPNGPRLGQAAPVVQRMANGTATQLPQQLVHFPSSGGQPLPPAVRQKMEAAFGTSFDAVRVHTGPHTAALGAHALTCGTDIHFAPGHYDLNTHRGRHLLGHELAHVLQQKSGRVRNPFGTGVALFHDAMLEAEAERMGARAAVLALTAAPSPIQRMRASSRVIQRHPLVSVQVNSPTLLRESLGGMSLAEGKTYAEVTGKHEITIDKGDAWDSRLGLDATVGLLGQQVWYRVMRVDEHDLSDRDVYIHSAAFAERRQITEGIVICPFKGPVRTFGGMWEAVEYHGKMGKIDPSARGLHMKLRFTPMYPADATEIVLVQTVRTFKNDDFYYIDEKVRERSYTGTSIDQRADSISPAYASRPDDLSRVEPGAGEHGHRYFDGISWNVKPAWLEDNPHIRKVSSFSGQQFETTALATQGKDKGTYYGSVKWGWFWKKNQSDVELIGLQVESYGSASPVFNESVSVWNRTPASGGQMPIPLPSVPRREV